MGQGIAVAEGDGGGRRHRPAAFRFAQAALRLPAPSGAALAPGVGQLDRRHAALRFHETGDAGQGLDVLVAPDAHVPRADAALR